MTTQPNPYNWIQVKIKEVDGCAITKETVFDIHWDRLEEVKAYLAALSKDNFSARLF